MGLADEILQAVPGVVQRRTWWDDLPEEVAAEMLDVRRRFHDGEYGTLKRYQLAELLFNRCREHGWKTCDARRLAVWLAKND